MARRIALVVIALVAVLLALVAVPLGLLTANQNRHDFSDDTLAAAATVSGVAEEHLADHFAVLPMIRAITGLRRSGDLVAVYDAQGNWVAGTSLRPSVSRAQITRALAISRPRQYATHDRLLVVMPVTSDSGRSRLGVVALARSTETIDHQQAVLWAWLALVSFAGLLAVAFIATALARWVGRPLAALEAVAQRLGDGDFGTRALASAGPEEVRRLSANFNRMAARLESLVDGHRVMMADVSHQLRTPLAALRLRLDVLAQDTPAGLADELAGAQDEVARLSRMVDGLLAVARAENVTTAPVPVQVASVIRDRSAAWRPAADEKAVDVIASQVEPLTARMGEGHLEQILDNLLANALEAVAEHGHIRVSAAPAGGGRLRIIVADDGPGMTAQQQRAAFRRFASATPGGTGLGLAIVHRLVTSDGGTAELSDTPGGGLTVMIELPAIPRERAQRWPGTSAFASRDL